MSEEGIKIAAQVFSAMQETRCKLLGLGAIKDGAGHTVSVDKQNIVLGQMFGDMNDAFKNKFMKIVGEKLYGEGP